MPAGTFVYFAYGSNMLAERLKKRCLSAQPLGTAIAPGFFVSFCKRSTDDSGKATLVRTGGLRQEAHGVLYEICRNERINLDRAEGQGRGYNRCDSFAVIRLSDRKKLATTTYIAPVEACDESLVPYDWYRALILAGALQHRLPDPYAEDLRRVAVQSDPNSERRSRQEALCVLVSAGFLGLLENHS